MDNDHDRFARILYQGAAFAYATPAEPALFGEIQLLGVEPDDSAWLYVDAYGKSAGEPGRRFKYTGAESPSDEATFTLQADPWQASLDSVYTLEPAPADGIGRLTEMNVFLTSTTHIDELAANPPVAMLCVPEALVGCGHETWQKDMTRIDADTWVATFTPRAGSDELPLYGIVKVEAPGVGELIRWFRDVGGVGPGHKIGGAPLREGSLMVDAVGEGSMPVDAANIQIGGLDHCNRVMVMPAADYQALGELPVSVAALVAAPLDIDILLGPGQCGNRLPGDVAIPSPALPIRLTMFYNKETIRRLGINDEHLVILQYHRNTGWEVKPNVKHNPRLNLVSTTSFTKDGIYAIGWQPP